MSRLFYHTMQDNAGNLLFGVSGTMRLAGSGTLATIYGDEGLTVILPNPMTNHPSFGSFKCFLPVGDFDFYMAKAGYTFETLTGIQGYGSMAQQESGAVAITGGGATFTGEVYGINFLVANRAGNDQVAFQGGLASGTNRYNLYMLGGAPNYLAGPLAVGGFPAVGQQLTLVFNATGGMNGLQIVRSGAEGGGDHVRFLNAAAAVVGTIYCDATTTAYNTSSDARLKRDITPLTGALGVVQALRPVAFLWNADGSPGRGFLAEEVQEVIPDGVITGERDAVDDEGRIIPQMIDYSKLVPWLVGAIQTLTARLAVLEDALGV